jgi:hypothetical protein
MLQCEGNYTSLSEQCDNIEFVGQYCGGGGVVVVDVERTSGQPGVKS